MIKRISAKKNSHQINKRYKEPNENFDLKNTMIKAKGNPTLRPTIINLLKTKDNEKFLKQRRNILVLVGKNSNNRQFLIRNCVIRKELAHFSSAGKKAIVSPIPNLATKFSGMREIQTSQTKKN